MSNKPTPEQIAKLPKWAQAHIAALVRQRDRALAETKAAADASSPSPFYIDDWHSEIKQKRYIQSPTKNLSVEYAGVKLDIFLPRNDDGQRLYGIELRYEAMVKSLTHFPIAIMPRGISTIQLVAKENMR